NDPVPLNWLMKYSDEIDSDDNTSLGFKKLTLKIKTEDSDSFQNFSFISDAVAFFPDENDNYSFSINPIGYNTASGPDLLKEGENIVKFSIYGGVYSSEEKTVIINVPKLTPNLTSRQKSITASTAQTVIKPLLEFKYLEDETYRADPSKLVIVVWDENKK